MASNKCSKIKQYKDEDIQQGSWGCLTQLDRKKNLSTTDRSEWKNSCFLSTFATVIDTHLMN